MARNEITGKRSLAFSKWHRENLPDDASYLDLDCVEFCHHCTLPLAVIELVSTGKRKMLKETATSKPSRYTRYVAEKLGVPAYVVSYLRNDRDELDFVAVLQVNPRRRFIGEMTSDELAAFINKLHDCKHCRELNKGRFSAKRMLEDL